MEPGYRIIDLVGTGIRSKVYKGIYTGQADFSRVVALKIPRTDSRHRDALRDDLLEEARLLAHMDHPGTVRVERTIRVDGQWAVVMEYVEGVLLARIIEKGPIPTVPALHITEHLAILLNDVHRLSTAQGLAIYGDIGIRSSNVAVSRHGTIKLMGIECRSTATMNRKGSNGRGGDNFTAPEVCSGSRPLPASDIFSLGQLLYTMLLGRSFSSAGIPEGDYNLLLDEALNALLNIRGGVDQELLVMLIGMLSWDPANRPGALKVATNCAALAKASPTGIFRPWVAHVVLPLIDSSDSTEHDALIGRVFPELGEYSSQPSGQSRSGHATEIIEQTGVFEPTEQLDSPRPDNQASPARTSPPGAASTIFPTSFEALADLSPPDRSGAELSSPPKLAQPPSISTQQPVPALAPSHQHTDRAVPTLDESMGDQEQLYSRVADSEADLLDSDDRTTISMRQPLGSAGEDEVTAMPLQDGLQQDLIETQIMTRPDVQSLALDKTAILKSPGQPDSRPWDDSGEQLETTNDPTSRVPQWLDYFDDLTTKNVSGTEISPAGTGALHSPESQDSTKTEVPGTSGDSASEFESTHARDLPANSGSTLPLVEDSEPLSSNPATESNPVLSESTLPLPSERDIPLAGKRTSSGEIGFDSWSSSGESGEPVHSSAMKTVPLPSQPISDNLAGEATFVSTTISADGSGTSVLRDGTGNTVPLPGDGAEPTLPLPVDPGEGTVTALDINNTRDSGEPESRSAPLAANLSGNGTRKLLIILFILAGTGFLGLSLLGFLSWFLFHGS